MNEEKCLLIGVSAWYYSCGKMYNLITSSVKRGGLVADTDEVVCQTLHNGGSFSGLHRSSVFTD